jgi:benzoyl-CoA reductase subunit C
MNRSVFQGPPDRAAVIDWARAIYEDIDFASVREQVAAGVKACGYLPVYAPKEVIRAAGMLPVGVHGGGDRLEIIRGDAFYQSYICHLPRSIVELQQSGRLSMLSAMVFPSTCDVIRNLSGMWQVLEPSMYVRYCDVPQVSDWSTGGQFWKHELQVLFGDLCKVAGVAPDVERMREAVATYNRVRAALRALYEARRDAPWKVPSEELYVLVRAGEVVPAEDFLEAARRYLAAVAADDARPRDRVRVVVTGAFCEQPPLGLIKTLERAGCYIVDDDFVLGNRMITSEVPTDGDPFEQLSNALIRSSVPSSILYEHDPEGKKRLMRDRVKAARADGIVFAAPSFCDPALLDRPMLKQGADDAGIPCIAFQYSENTGQFQQFREQAGTFSDSIKLWGPQ